MDNSFGGMSEEEFFLGHDAMIDEDDPNSINYDTDNSNYSLRKYIDSGDSRSYYGGGCCCIVLVPIIVIIMLILLFFKGVYAMVGKYKVITLCGSTRFKKEFMETQKRLTLEGNIVISVGLFGHSRDSEVWENMDEGTITKTKKMLDDMHKRKIDMADEIFVIDVGGYIGDSTKSEIEYAKGKGKVVRYLEG